jgi:hypothetical protein
VDKNYARASTNKSEMSEDERKPLIIGTLAVPRGINSIVGEADWETRLRWHLRGEGSSSDADDESTVVIPSLDPNVTFSFTFIH